ncbi:MAG: DUF1018 domain-containing protein [Magnetococcales bacterium]|nr:DUF1018 domain-containing protein [Magnetococcales bacterium]MBF0114696.1 DUF1018 domain-containing protein [Magnetococcales bacterium]
MAALAGAAAGPTATKAMVSKIHIARSQLGMTEDEYRALLHGETGKESCAQMDHRELSDVLARMIRLGFRSTPPKKERQGVVAAGTPEWSRKRPNNWSDTGKNPMYRKIYALICVNQWDWGYVRATAQHMFAQKGAVVLEFLGGDELHALVSALQIASNRNQRRQG